MVPDPPPRYGLAPENTNTVRLPPDFVLPPQKALPANSDPIAGGWAPDNMAAAPLLVASNDDSMVAALVDEARKENDLRNADSTGDAAPGHHARCRAVTSVVPPTIAFDHGFLDSLDGRHAVDDSKRQPPTLSDRVKYGEWLARCVVAEMLRPDLTWACMTYRHYMEGKGEDFQYSYDDYVDDDRAGATTLASAIEDIRGGAIAALRDRGGTQDSFLIQSSAIGVGASGSSYNPRYPYPGTQEWQMTIGGHVIWLEASVSVSPAASPDRLAFTVRMTLHALDRYNFDPGKVAIGSGVPDAVNGRFQIVGLAMEFMSYATLRRDITFSVARNDKSDPYAAPADQQVATPLSGSR